MNRNIDVLLSRLEKVNINPSKSSWKACCPAHDDKNPSLFIRETDEGTVLLHCFSGCSPAAITASIGLELKDLFPPKLLRDDLQYGKRRKPLPMPWYQLLPLLREDMTAVMMAVADIAAGKPLKSADYDRLGAVALRLYEVLESQT